MYCIPLYRHTYVYIHVNCTYRRMCHVQLAYSWNLPNIINNQPGPVANPYMPFWPSPKCLFYVCVKTANCSTGTHTALTVCTLNSALWPPRSLSLYMIMTGELALTCSVSQLPSLALWSWSMWPLFLCQSLLVSHDKTHTSCRIQNLYCLWTQKMAFSSTMCSGAQTSMQSVVVGLICTPHSDTHSGDMCSGAQTSMQSVVVGLICTPHSDTHSGDMCSGAQTSMQSVMAGLTPHSETHSGH